MEPLRLGIIGVGGMGGQHLTMAKVGDSHPEVRFAALADARPDLVAAKSAEYGIPGFTSAETLIDSGLCEAVLVATPHPYHAPICEYAASKGLHVLTEKPIAVSVSEADRMIAACERAGVLLGVMFQQRTMPLYRAAKAIVESGALGRLYRSTLVASEWYRTQTYYDSGSWRGTWAGEGGGVIMNQAPHHVDLFIWLGGLPVSVSARVDRRWHRIEVEDTVEALLDFGDGKSGYFYTTTSEWPGETRFELAGENGKLVIAGDRLRLYRLAKSLPEQIFEGAMWGKCEGDWQDVEYTAAPQSHAAVVAQFARAIRLGEPLVATGEDGRRALELANSFLLSGNREKPVRLPLDRDEYDTFLAEMRAQR